MCDVTATKNGFVDMKRKITEKNSTRTQTHTHYHTEKERPTEKPTQQKHRINRVY